LASAGGSSQDNPEEALKKCSIGGKDECPIGNKCTKHLKNIEDIAEHIGSKLGIVVKKEMPGEVIVVTLMMPEDCLGKQ